MANFEVLQAKVAFWAGPIFVKEGSLVRVGHDVMRGREHLFQKLHIDFDLPPEVRAAAAAKSTAAKQTPPPPVRKAGD